MSNYSLWQISPLIRDMAKNKTKQERIRYEFNNVHIDVIVLIDREPFELLFGIIDHNYAFTLHMASGYQLELPPYEIYCKLCSILGIRGHGHGFSSFSFIHNFAQHIPQTYSGVVLQPHEIAIHMVRDVTSKEPIDAADCIYFKGWRHHETDGRNARNFAKTRRFLGDDAYRYCLENNISSCWGPNLRDARSYETPQIYLARKNR